MVAFTGTDLWKPENTSSDAFGMGKTQVTHILLYIICVFEFTSIFSHVATNINKNRDSEHFKKRYSATTLFTQMGFMPILICVWAAYLFVPGSNSAGKLNTYVVLAYGAQWL